MKTNDYHIGPESQSISLLEEPFAHPPQQTKLPEMSVMEESMTVGLLSAREPHQTNMSILSGSNLLQSAEPTEKGIHWQSSTLQNPFIGTPHTSSVGYQHRDGA